MNAAIVLKEALRVGCLSSLYSNKWQTTGESWNSLDNRSHFGNSIFFFFYCLKGLCKGQKALTEKEFHSKKNKQTRNLSRTKKGLLAFL